jgi:hypothetical protein
MRVSTPTETRGTAVTPLTDEEVRIIRRLRLMRASARKMIFDLTAEYARDFPDPDQFAGAS